MMKDNCLEEMFYTGLLDDEFDTFCATLNIMMYVMLVFVATLMVIQFIASIICPCQNLNTATSTVSELLIFPNDRSTLEYRSVSPPATAWLDPRKSRFD